MRLFSALSLNLCVYLHNYAFHLSFKLKIGSQVLTRQELQFVVNLLAFTHDALQSHVFP